MTTQVKAAVERFLSALFEPNDTIEVRAIPRLKRCWFFESYFALVDQLDELLAVNSKGDNLYFGANPRARRGGTDADVSVFRCLFVDIDEDVGEAAVLERAEKAGLPEPTALVMSGHGWQCWWRLAEPMTDAAAWTTAQRRLISAMRSDHRIKDPARIMRLPGTINTKSDPWVRAELARCADAGQCVYPIDDLLAVLPPVEKIPHESVLHHERAMLSGERAKLAYATMDFVMNGAREGERNHRLFNAACDMCGCGYTADEAWAKLEPPASMSGLGRDEIQTAIESAFGKQRTPAKPPTVEMPSKGWSAIPDEMLNEKDAATEAAASFTRRNASPEATTAPAPAKGLLGFFSFGSDWIRKFDGERPVFTNSVHIAGTGDEKSWFRHVPADRLAASLLEMTGGWPRSAGGQLFYPHSRSVAGRLPSPGCVAFVNDADALFAWVNGISDVHWTRKDVRSADKQVRSSLTKGEFLEYLRTNPGVKYRGIEMLPHYPPADDVWYAPCDLPDDGGEALAEILTRLNCETEMDRVIALAVILTGGWGGPMGARPAAMLTSTHGRGVGKTSTAMLVASIWGLAVQIGPKEDFDKAMGRLLSGEALNGRAVVIDNIKGRMDSDRIDALITSQTIEGHKLYVGHTTRPNRLLTLMTSNQPRLSTDLAERSVILRIGSPKWQDSGWGAWAREMVDQKRGAVVASAVKIMEGAYRAGWCAKGSVEVSAKHRDRWGPWQAGPLAAACWALGLAGGEDGSVVGSGYGRLRGLLGASGDGLTLDGVAAEIIRRRRDVDDDATTGEDIADEIEKAIRAAGRDPKTDSVHITNKCMAAILHESEMAEDRMSSRGVASWVGGLAGAGALASLSKSRPRGQSRGWRWSETDKPAGWLMEKPGVCVPMDTLDEDDLPI